PWAQTALHSAPDERAPSLWRPVSLPDGAPQHLRLAMVQMPEVPQPFACTTRTGCTHSCRAPSCLSGARRAAAGHATQSSSRGPAHSPSSNTHASRGTGLAQASDMGRKTAGSCTGGARARGWGRAEKRAGNYSMLDELSTDVARLSLRPAGDAVLRHFVVQGAAFDAEPRGGPLRPTNHPLGVLERLEDLRPFGLVEGTDPRGGTGSGALQRG